MRISEIGLSLFDLRHTFESGQPLTFHADYNPTSNSLLYVAGNKTISVGYLGKQKSGKMFVISDDPPFAVKEARRRFRLSDNMKQIYKEINTDKFMDESIKKYPGMRLTLNDQWETTLCFIISQYNNVPRIRKIVRSIIGRFGPEIKDPEGKVIGRMFPKSSDLLGASIKDLLECGTGFRARYIKEAAEYCTNNLDLYALNPRKYDELKDSLLEITGVGDKVADCIALMGYGNLNAFPIDVWVKRTVENAYFKGKEMKMRDIHDFSIEKWGGVRGYAQQYLFWHGRQMDKEASKYVMVN